MLENYKHLTTFHQQIGHLDNNDVKINILFLKTLR